MRYAIIGAGAVGCTIGGLISRSGGKVTLVARGEQLEALRKNGLLLQRPDGSFRQPVEAVSSIAEIDIGNDDAVILAMKTQDTVAALEEMAIWLPASVAVLCAQNGIANERFALRYFENVYGLVVMLPAMFVSPGIVQNPVAPTAGVLDIGRYPSGVDDFAQQCAADFANGGFSSRAVADIMRWKAAKLVQNVKTSVEAFLPAGEAVRTLGEEAAVEARRCLAAAGIAMATPDEMAERRAGLMVRAPIDGIDVPPRSSLLQSLERRSGTIETPYFNGEIVLLGRLHGVPCPVNAALLRLSLRLAHAKGEAHGLNMTELVEEIAAGR